MNFIQRILEHSRNARVPRARDPETHEPIPYGTDAPAMVKIGAKILSTSWASRMILKWIAALGGFMTTFLIAKGAGEHTPVIVGGVLALATFLYEQLASYLSAKASMKIPPHVGAQSLAPAQSVSTSNSGGSSRSAMFHAIIADSRRMTPEESKASSAAFWKEMKPVAKPTSTAEDDAALLDLRASLAETQRINLPTQAELEATRAKLEGYPVEFEGKVLNFDSATLAYMFRNQCKLDGKTANVLF